MFSAESREGEEPENQSTRTFRNVNKLYAFGLQGNRTSPYGPKRLRIRKMDSPPESAEHVAEPSSWQPHPRAAAFVRVLLNGFCRRSLDVRQLLRRLQRDTGTRLIDWVDHFVLPAEDRLETHLRELGFEVTPLAERHVWQHPAAVLPDVVTHGGAVRQMAIKVDSVADFLRANRINDRTIHGNSPESRVRKARIARRPDVELWVLERHGCRGWQSPLAVDARAVSWHKETFRRRRRRFDMEAVGFEHTGRLIRQAVSDLGTGLACDTFFSAEREYWLSRNRAGRIQKARQDALGLGWGNHDHHTYRSSRQHFHRLLGVLAELGLAPRERFYAGKQAGWGAQVLQQSDAGIVVFADVDLMPAEVSTDFTKEPLLPQGRPGTIGLWCKLHGEALFQAGMHHLECRFDFDAVCRQLRQAGIETMKPFTDLPYLKQAFTQGEIWPVEPDRIEAAWIQRAVTQKQAECFRGQGAIGSHLEILQRDDGYKGFNQAGIGRIIRETDPRRRTGGRTTFAVPK